MKNKLLEREYESTVVEAGIKKVREMSREEALQRAEKGRKSKMEDKGGRQHRLITEFDRRTGPRLKQVLEDNYNQMVDRDQRLEGYFPNIPKPTFTRGKNIKELLCRAKLPPNRPIKTREEAEKFKNGITRCSKGKGKGGCLACSYITSTPREIVKSVRIYNAGGEIPVQGRLNCKTEGFLYVLWSAKKPNMQYLGRCSRSVGARFREHRNSIINKEVGKAIPAYFMKIKSYENDLRFVPFIRMKDKNPFGLMAYEKYLINKYNLVASRINLIR